MTNENDEHTPGPWDMGILPKSDQSDFLVIRPRGEFPHGEWIADVGYVGIPEREANARLIAAAPDLLAALERTFEQIEAQNGLCADEFPTTFTAEEVSLIRAAIGRARGCSVPA